MNSGLIISEDLQASGLSPLKQKLQWLAGGRWVLGSLYLIPSPEL
nr:hypothetical protein Iba_scaffold87008CG0010 [Ipomoea batatas]